MKQPKRSDFPAGPDGAVRYSKALSKYLASSINNTEKFGSATAGMKKGSKLTKEQRENRERAVSHAGMGTKPKSNPNTEKYGSATAGMKKSTPLTPQQLANRKKAVSPKQMGTGSVKNVIKKARQNQPSKPKTTPTNTSKPAAKPEKFESKGYNPQLEKLRGGEIPKTKEQIAKAAARQALFRKQKKSGAYTGSYSKFNPKNFTMAGSFPPMA
tara:strand:+ start:39 stop:677 length:639 start_codon:yes stop_codon:yes gene_type:complete